MQNQRFYFKKSFLAAFYVIASIQMSKRFKIFNKHHLTIFLNQGEDKQKNTLDIKSVYRQRLWHG